MMAISLRTLGVLCVFFVSAVTSRAANPDLVTFLPGLTKQPSFTQYAGYLTGTGNHRLFYWFVESQSNPKVDPLLIWFNGGPGCSSLYGLLSEQGPFLVNDDGINLTYNPHSWNVKANVLYIESPPGTGFSYSKDGKLPSNDDMVTEDHYAAINYFFKKNPGLLLCPVFLVGQSYAGVYIPLLANKMPLIPGINFQGFAVGSPCANLRMLDNSLMYYAYQHGIIGVELWASLNKYCCTVDGTCNFHNSTSSKCMTAVAEGFHLVNEIGLNPFNIFQDCAGGIPPPSKIHKQSPDGLYHYPGMMKHMYTKNINTKNWWKKLEMMPVEDLIVGIPCVNTSAITRYLNDPYVKMALHVEPGLKDWKAYNPEVDRNYTQQYPDMTGAFKQILGTFKYRILVYNGDCDAVCNFLANEWFVNALGLEEEVQWRPWLYHPAATDQIAGFVKEYDNIAFVTVKGAGHYAPADKPIAMQQLLYNFLKKRPY